MNEKLMEIAYERGLEVVETTQGMNGYPQGLGKAVIGFESFEDAEGFAKEVNGEVVLLSRRDGHQFWTNNGRQYEPLERAKFIDENEIEMFTNIISFDSWAMEEIERNIGEGCNIYDIKNTSTICCEINEAIYDMDNERHICLVNKYNYGYDIEDKYVTKVHDDDVTTYVLAVVDHETDEDYAV